MTNLNFACRNKRKPTDVLSFRDYYPVDPMGEIYICPSTLGNAKTNKSKILQLLAHGLLHLLGYDHEEPDEAEQMFSIEKDILSTFIALKCGNQ